MNLRTKPSKLVVDPSVVNLEITATVDVSAPDNDLIQGKYVVYDGGPSANEAWVITAMSCFAWARTNVGDTSEGVQMISPRDGNGFFQFEPLVGTGAAFGLSPFSLAAWSTAATATADDVKTGTGITMLSDAPFDAMHQAEGNGIRRFLVPPGQPLTVLFSLIQVSRATPLPARFAVGGTTPFGVDDPRQRVDFAGVIMTGSKMSKTHYDQLARQMDAGR